MVQARKACDVSLVVMRWAGWGESGEGSKHPTSGSARHGVARGEAGPTSTLRPDKPNIQRPMPEEHPERSESNVGDLYFVQIESAHVACCRRRRSVSRRTFGAPGAERQRQPHDAGGQANLTPALTLRAILPASHDILLLRSIRLNEPSNGSYQPPGARSILNEGVSNDRVGLPP